MDIERKEILLKLQIIKESHPELIVPYEIDMEIEKLKLIFANGISRIHGINELYNILTNLNLASIAVPKYLEQIKNALLRLNVEELKISFREIFKIENITDEQTIRLKEIFLSTFPIKTSKYENIEMFKYIKQLKNL